MEKRLPEASLFQQIQLDDRRYPSHDSGLRAGQSGHHKCPSASGFCFGEGAGVFGRGDLWMKQVGDNTRNGIARVCPNITKTMTATVWVVYAKQVQLTG